MSSSMTEKVRERLLQHATLMSFYYKGIRCNVDPFSDDDYCIVCDGEFKDVRSIDEVMKTPFFLGERLEDIADKVDFDEW